MSSKLALAWKSRGKMKKILVGVIAITAILATSALASSWNWKRIVVARLETGSQVIETARGRIEYVTYGDGQAVLISHGLPGGYDQGLILAKLVGSQEFKFISVSRPGYLRTPLDVGRTYEEQADAFAALLDALNIQQAAIIGVSSGGPAALQFALRHPGRCWGLVMMAAMSLRPQGSPPPVGSWYGKLATSDLAMWGLDILVTHQLGLFLSLIMPDEAQRARLLDNPENLELFVELVQTAYPYSLRSEGAANDIEQHSALPRYPLERIDAPTLALYGTADFQAPFTNAELLANTIPDIELVTIKGGNHSFPITDRDVVWPKVYDFLSNHAPK